MSATAPIAISSNSPLTGIAYKVAAVAVFLIMSSLLKASQGVPAGELVFFRSFFGILPVVVFLAWRGELRVGLKTQSVTSQIWRGLFGTGSMFFSFVALTKLPLPEAVTLNYATPLMIVVFSALFLREVVRLYRWTAVLVGFAGVVIIAWPRLTLLSGGFSDEAMVGVAAALLSCCFAGIATMLVRKLVRSERPATIVLYFLSVSSLIALATAPFGWVMPTPVQFAYLIGAGLAGGIAQVLLTESYRHADMSVIAPFEYSSLILSIGIGYVFFGDMPSVHMLLGGLIVVGSGLFIIYREQRLGLDQAAARQVTTPQG